MRYELSHIRFPSTSDENTDPGVISPLFEISLFAIGSAVGYDGQGNVNVERIERLIALAHEGIDLFIAKENRLYGAVDRDGAFDRMVFLGGHATPMMDEISAGEALRPLTLSEIVSMHGEALTVSWSCDELVGDDGYVLADMDGGLGRVTDTNLEGAMALWYLELGARAMEQGDAFTAADRYLVAGCLIGFTQHKAGFDSTPGASREGDSFASEILESEITKQGIEHAVGADPKALGRLGGHAKSRRLRQVRAFVSVEFARWPEGQSIASFARKHKDAVLQMASELGYPLSATNIERQISDWVRASRSSTASATRTASSG